MSSNNNNSTVVVVVMCTLVTDNSESSMSTYKTKGQFHNIVGSREDSSPDPSRKFTFVSLPLLLLYTAIYCFYKERFHLSGNKNFHNNFYMLIKRKGCILLLSLQVESLLYVCMYNCTRLFVA